MKPRPLTVFAFMCLLFAGYSASIYLTDEQAGGKGFTASQAADGKLVWQKYNCQSCHQLYGLGGYLGPDLSHVYARFKGKGSVLDALLASGNQRMPVYRLNASESEALLMFFRAMDASGKADPRSFSAGINGTIYHER
jgi:nitric oxide reductase subunit C